jgi:hypothetical protein
LLSVFEGDHVLADQVDAAYMAVEVDAHAGPVEARGDLFDVRGLAGAVIALDHHAAVMREARKDSHRGVVVELVRFVACGDVGVVFGKTEDFPVDIEAEGFSHVVHPVRNGGIFGAVGR